MSISFRPAFHTAELDKTDLGLRCVESRTVEAFSALQSVWDNLLVQGSVRSPFQEWSWLWAVWEALSSADAMASPYVVTVYDGPIPVAIFPFLHPGGTGPLELRRIRPLGYASYTERSALTEEPPVVIRAGYERSATEAVREHLTRFVRTSSTDCFVVWTRRQNAPVPGLDLSFRRGVARWEKFKVGPQVAALPASWNEFRRGLSKSMRDNTAYYPKLLSRHGHTWSVEVLRQPEQMDMACRELIALHKSRVHCDKGPRHADYFPTELQTRLLLEGQQRLAAVGKGFVGRLVVDGRTVASQAFMRQSGTLVFFYSGFDPSWAKYSPLLLLQSEVLRQEIDTGARRLDLLGGQAAWQSRWGAKPEGTLSKVIGLRLRPVSLVRAMLYVIRREVSAELRRGKIARSLERWGLKPRTLSLITSIPEWAPRLMRFHRFVHMGTLLHASMPHR